MARSTRVYDSKKVVVTVGDHVVTGFADGTFVTVSKNEDKFNTVIGGQGEVTRVLHGNKQGTITLTLKHTSPSSAYLRALANGDEIVPVRVIDENEDSALTAGGDEAWLMKPADESRGGGVENITWTFTVGEYSVR